MTNHQQPSRERFFVRVVSSDGQFTFVDATEHVGSVMPFQKPRATLAMSVGDDTVAFSVLHLTSKTNSLVKDRPIEFPRGPITRLMRRSAAAPLDDTTLIVEVSNRIPGPALSETGSNTTEEASSGGLDDLFSPNALSDLFAEGTPDAEQPADDSAAAPKKRQRQSEITSWTFGLQRTPDGIASIDARDSDGDTTFVLPVHPLRVSLYLTSPVTGRNLAVSFIGHMGKPGTRETMVRIAAKILNSLIHLPEFALLSQISTVDTPDMPGRRTASPAVTQVTAAQFDLRTFLFNTDLLPITVGDTAVSVSLENANSSAGRLYITCTPDAALAAHWDTYGPMVETAVHDSLTNALTPAGLSNLVYDIVLGAVTPDTVDRIVEAGASMPAVDIAPTQWRPHN